jgi:UDP-2-acetamido-3-amino-2,3-dideoxy-glucuronate N-acetyltransferase
MNFISDKAILNKNISFGHFVVIEDYVEIGANCIIGSNVVIHKGSRIGNNVRIDDNTVIGKFPMKSVNSIFKEVEKLSSCIINDDCLIGTGVVIYVGSKIGEKTLVADLATVRENVIVGNNTIVGRGVAIENFTTIGNYCKIETNAYITAYSSIEDYVFIAPGVVTSNDNFAARSKERYKHFKGVTVKRGGRIGAQATILPGKIIEEDAFIAAGSVVTKDVKNAKIVAGNPARELKDVPEDQLLKNQV